MPRHPPTEPTEYAERETLVNELAKEIHEPRPVGQPIILENSGTGTRSILTHVIWDRWEECPRELRADIILDAYEKSLGVGYREKISLALGVTVPEAVAIGLLPYAVRPALRLAPAQPSQEEYRRAMVEAGASTLSGARWPILRCATLEDAEATQDYLRQSLADSNWIIVQEVDPGDAASGQ
jgi:hypothetical protein